MSASINISSRRHPASARRTRVIGQAGFMGGVKRRRPARAAFITRPVRIVLPPIRGEKKFFDVSAQVATAITWANQTSHLCIPAEGITAQLRIGNKINVVSLHVRCFLSVAQLESQTAPLSQIVTRVLIVQSNDGTVPAIGDVVDTGSTSDLLSWRNMDNTSEYSILSDFYLKVDPHVVNEGNINLFAHGAAASDVVRYNKNWKTPLKVQFKTGTATPSNMTFYLMAISSATGATLNIETRTRFTDF